MLKRVGMTVFMFVAAFVALFSYVGNSQAADRLSDIPSQAAQEINFLLDKEIIAGYEDRTFKPQRNVTRAEAAIMLGRALKLDGKQRSTSFSDVGSSAKASGYIQSAVNKGIIKGYEDGTFKPDDTINRGEMAYLLENAFEFKEMSSVSFSDIGSSGRQFEAVNKMATAGITGGDSDGKFRPSKDVNRQEFSLFVARALNPEYRISKINEPIKEEPIKEEYVKVSSNDVLNVRSGSGASHSIVGKLKLNDQVSVYSYEGDWARIKSGSVTGYVNSYYLTSTKVEETKKYKITLDAGHGGSDPGASGNGIIEKELTLDIAKRVERLLKDRGYEVVMTRSTDVKPSWDHRVQSSVKSGSDAFVSIHGNAAGASASGTETFYSSKTNHAKDSKQLATFIQNRLYKAMDTKNRGVKDANFIVIRENNSIPAVLVELGFMTNKEDARKLKSNSYRDEAARAITQGIVDYFNWKS